MSTKLRPELQRLMGCSYNEVERHHRGSRLCNQFFHIWMWAAPRMGGVAGERQDHFYTKFGPKAYYARINKVRAACGFKLLSIPLSVG